MARVPHPFKEWSFSLCFLTGSENPLGAPHHFPVSLPEVPLLISLLRLWKCLVFTEPSHSEGVAILWCSATPQGWGKTGARARWLPPHPRCGDVTYSCHILEYFINLALQSSLKENRLVWCFKPLLWQPSKYWSLLWDLYYIVRIRLLIFKILFLFFFCPRRCSMQDLSSPTRDRTCVPCSGRAES